MTLTQSLFQRVGDTENFDFFIHQVFIKRLCVRYFLILLDPESILGALKGSSWVST